MRVNILKYVFFSIIICSFEYAKNELYFITETTKCLERNVLNFRNNRALADADSQFDLNNFYESTLSFANQFSDYIGDDKEMTNFRNDIDSQIKKHKENNTLPNLNNVDKKTKKLIYKLQKELEETTKELDNKRNGELAIQPVHDKRIMKKDENISVSEHEDFIQLEDHENVMGSEHDHFEYEYNRITSSISYKIYSIDKQINALMKRVFKAVAAYVVCFFMIVASGGKLLILILTPYLISAIRNLRKISKLESKKNEYK
ncbi:fam-b protein [Plasmodium chabaudi adami]|uniref:Fam-b protein n=1 Tax=Plasmodium chabaudi adami TaxID=5826 RepID=A0A1C6WN81_PLACE|nr:fam-b protein [Plasmodium chabaudi adami]